MTGLWVASYVAIWVIIVALLVLQVGVLRELGLIRQPKGTPFTLPTVETDGPGIGETLPDLKLETANGYGDLVLASSAGMRTVLVTLAATCESCQKVVKALNEVSSTHAGQFRIVGLVRGNSESARGFVGLFRPNFPAVLDLSGELATLLQVRNNPFGLLYDESGHLIRKGSVSDRDTVLALLGDAGAPEAALLSVYPQPARTPAPKVATSVRAVR